VLLLCYPCFLLPVLLTDPSPSSFYTLSLHDALPILLRCGLRLVRAPDDQPRPAEQHQSEQHQAGAVHPPLDLVVRVPRLVHATRSEEHTSELQSRENLVCRLLLEKKKKKKYKKRHSS